MAGFRIGAPPLPVVLAVLVLWGSVAWGLPAELPAAEGEADGPPAEGAWECGLCGATNDASAKYCRECGAKKGGETDVAVKDPWAGVRISGAYDYAKCPECGYKNDLRAGSCSRCGYELPQPSAEVKDPELVFVPGKGYYREGTLLESGRSGKGLTTAGLILMPVGVLAFGVAGALVYSDEHGSLPTYGSIVLGFGGLGAIGAGVVLLVIGLTSRKEPVYAFATGERYEPEGRPVFGFRSGEGEEAELKVEVSVLAF